MNAISMEPQEHFMPSPAESFEIDFLNAQNREITRALATLNFVFRRAY